MRHVEPFLGGGAVFFGRAPKQALLGDINQDLIAVYAAVCSSLQDVIEELRAFSDGHCREQYHAVRDECNERRDVGSARHAAMFLYLNKTCYNGLYRVNRRGKFNVPMGKYTNPRILDDNLLIAARELLQSAELRCQDFESLLADAKPGDFVYLDPPYDPVSETSFTAYAEGGFSRDDQVRMRNVYESLDRRGCALMLSNSDSPFIRELYVGYRVDEVTARRAINSKGERRGGVTEVVIRNYGA